MKNYEEFEKRTAAWYNLSKIVALIIVAFWTLYQWNKSIFPIEKINLNKELALQRENLRIDSFDPGIDFSIDVDKYKEQGVANLKFNILSSIKATNITDYPILCKFDTIEFIHYGYGIDEIDAHVSEYEKVVYHTYKVPAKKLLTLKTDYVLEKDNSFKSKFQHYFEYRILKRKQETYIEMKINYSLTSIDVNTGELNESTINKSINSISKIYIKPEEQQINSLIDQQANSPIEPPHIHLGQSHGIN